VDVIYSTCNVTVRAMRSGNAIPDSDHGTFLPSACEVLGVLSDLTGPKMRPGQGSG
jgi:hypothetical protein